jgi:3',5'-cyclic AMP phosphodiesterase CpdA
MDLPGVTLALLDTVIPGTDTGTLDDDQLEWLDDLAAEKEREGTMVMAMGHHHPWSPHNSVRPDSYFGIHPDWSERLFELIARRPAIVAYTCGHTHRNRVRRFPELTAEVPFVEVGCTKDFPGSWAEYRVFEGGILQVHHRTSTPAALAWSEQCRGLYMGTYEQYASGTVDDRCFVINRRT